MFVRSAMALLLLATAALPALADIPGGRFREPERAVPRPNPPAVAPAQTTFPVTVKQADLSKEGKGVQAKVAIPRKLLAKLAPGAVPARGVQSAPEARQSSLPWWSTVIAGVAMSAGAVGVVFVARGNKAARKVVAMSVGVALLTGGYALGDLRIPDEEEGRPAGGETIILEVTDDGDAVVLTLPPA